MEGYEEIEIKNPLNSYITKIIKSCNNCKHRKNILVRSGINPQYKSVCGHKDCNDHSRLIESIHGYHEPPGFDGEECPFHQQLLREKTINKLLEE